MRAIVEFFIDLCFFKSKPEETPPSRILFLLAVAMNASAGIALAISVGRDPALALRELALILCFLYLALSFRRVPYRFVQAGTALMGATAILDIIALPIARLATTAERGADGAMMLLMLMVLWGVAVLGYILAASLGTSMRNGVIVGSVYTALCYVALVVSR